MALIARSSIRRLLILIASLAVITPLSWKAGQLVAHRKAEAARRDRLEESRSLMEEQRPYLRVGSQIPDFPLLQAEDGARTSLYQALPAGGAMVLAAPGCPNCETTLQLIQSAIKNATRARRVILVASESSEALRDWRSQRGLEIPFYSDAERFIEGDQEFTVIPFVVVIAPDHTIRETCAGGKSESEYVTMLEEK